MAVEDYKYYWWTKNNKVGVAYYYEGKFNAPAVKTVKVYYRIKPTELRYDTDVSELPEQFHSALAYRAIQAGYELNPEALNVASFWALKFDTLLKRIQEFKNKERKSGPPVVKSVYPYGVK